VNRNGITKRRYWTLTTREHEDGVASLVYTGEVYNFVELRDTLKHLGHHFKTCSDTEVVLRGYQQWGDKIAERLNGNVCLRNLERGDRGAVSNSRPHGCETAILLSHGRWRVVRLGAESDPRAPLGATARK
jgi:glutamine phosphoribosylpyrophosphate amidotransferase